MAKIPEAVVTIKVEKVRLTPEEIAKHAEEYSAPAVKLIRKILEKQARAMIEELQDQLTDDAAKP